MSLLRSGDGKKGRILTEPVELSHQDQNLKLKVVNKKLRRKMGDWSRLTEVLAASCPKLPIPKMPYKAFAPTKIYQELVVDLSDAHLNAAWDYSKTDGKSEYSFDIGCELLNYLVQEVCRLASQDRSKYGLHNLRLRFLGDILHGHLRVSDEVTNDFPTASSILSTAWVLFQAVCQLLANFRQIDIICMAGNHARLADKPDAHRYVEENLETIVYGMLKALVAEHKLGDRVTVTIPNSRIYTFNQLGHKIKVGHGDHIRGGNSIADVPIYGLGREILRQFRNDVLSGAEGGIALMEYGHWHQSCFLSNILLLNGSLCFTGPWAIEEKGVFTDPTQWVYYTSEKYAIGWSMPLSVKAGKGKGHPYTYDPEMFVGHKALTKGD